jgi:beta-N-acetylhexosaminidase
VVADDRTMVAAATDDTEADANPGASAVAALKAGCDLLISTGTLKQNMAMIDAIAAAVKSGDLDEARLDDAVERILTLKLRHGIVAAVDTMDQSLQTSGPLDEGVTR